MIWNKHLQPTVKKNIRNIHKSQQAAYTHFFQSKYYDYSNMLWRNYHGKIVQMRLNYKFVIYENN